MRPGAPRYPLQHGRRNVTIWMKPEHIAALDEMAAAESMDRAQFVLRLVTYGLKSVGRRQLSKRIYADVINRHPGASKEYFNTSKPI